MEERTAVDEFLYNVFFKLLEIFDFVRRISEKKVVLTIPKLIVLTLRLG